MKLFYTSGYEWLSSRPMNKQIRMMTKTYLNDS